MDSKASPKRQNYGAVRVVSPFAVVTQNVLQQVLRQGVITPPPFVFRVTMFEMVAYCTHSRLTGIKQEHQVNPEHTHRTMLTISL